MFRSGPRGPFNSGRQPPFIELLLASYTHAVIPLNREEFPLNRWLDIWTASWQASIAGVVVRNIPPGVVTVLRSHLDRNGSRISVFLNWPLADIMQYFVESRVRWQLNT